MAEPERTPDHVATSGTASSRSDDASFSDERESESHDALAPDCLDVFHTYCARFGLEPHGELHGIEYSCEMPREKQVQRTAEIFEVRLTECQDSDARLALLRALASLYAGPAEALERAFDKCTQILEMSPGDTEAYDRMERIDVALGRFERLVDTLIARAHGSEGEERAHFHLRVARLADEHLNALELACDHYREALNLRPGDPDILKALESIFERSDRANAFAQLLQEQSEAVADRTRSAALLSDAAERLFKAGELVAAQDVWERLVDEFEKPQALESLIDVLERHGDEPDALSARLLQLHELLRDVDFPRAHALLLRRATVQWNAMNDLEARESLRLARDLCEQARDLVRRAETLILQVEFWPLEEDVPNLARQAFELLREGGGEPERLVKALRFWSAAEPDAQQPHEELLPLLEQLGDFKKLVETLDAMAAMAVDRETLVSYEVRAAEITCHKLGDIDAAWQRLIPLVGEGHAAAQHAAGQLADMLQRNDELAALYVSLARGEQDPQAALVLWRAAARRYERAGTPALALEACLRALAKDLSRNDLLEYAERLAEAAGAWRRLGAVYERLIRTVDVASLKGNLLTRHAAVLEERLGERHAALERICQALQLTPQSDVLLEQAERLAKLTPSPQWMCDVYERRADAVTDESERIRALLAAADMAANIGEDSVRAAAYLTQAIVVAKGKDEHLTAMESHVLTEDDGRADGEVRRLPPAWSRALECSAGRFSTDAKVASELLRRAAAIELDHLHDGKRAFELLQRALELAPRDKSLLDALVNAAVRGDVQAELVAHLRKFADSTLFGETECAALRHLAPLLAALGDSEGEILARQRLFMLAREDREAGEQLCRCLEAAERHEDLLLALHRRLERASATWEKVPLLKAIARTWELKVKNRFESLDAWQRVLSIAPSDTEACEACERLDLSPFGRSSGTYHSAPESSPGRRYG